MRFGFFGFRALGLGFSVSELRVSGLRLRFGVRGSVSALTQCSNFLGGVVCRMGSQRYKISDIKDLGTLKGEYGI